MLQLLDSSGWLEYLQGGANADVFAPLFDKPNELLVPTIVLYEVSRCVMRSAGEDEAFSVASSMSNYRIVDCQAAIMLNAVPLSIEHKLPMADSIIYATAQYYNAVIWTQDADFKNLDSRLVKYFPNYKC